MTIRSLALGLVAGAAIVIPIAATGTTGTTDYTGPFTTAQHVPSVCLQPVTSTRYYNANAPAGTVELRTGGHGHGGYLKCIYIDLDGPPMYAGDHPYGKWLIFPGLGIKIPQPNGLIVNYQECYGVGYSFPGGPEPAGGNGSATAPNDCGESYLLKDGGTWVYQDGPRVGQPMFPAVTP